MKYDAETRKWFRSHVGQQTTVCKCDKCGLFYKPSLGHKCKLNKSLLAEQLKEGEENEHT